MQFIPLIIITLLLLFEKNQTANAQSTIFDSILEEILLKTINDNEFQSNNSTMQLKILRNIYSILNRHFLKIQITRHYKLKNKSRI